MNTNAEALAMFAKKKAAIGINEDTCGTLTVTERKNAIPSKKVPNNQARRPRDSRTPGKSVCYLTLFLIGSSIGISSAVLSIGTAAAYFGTKYSMLSNLWWIFLVAASLFMVGAKAQMDSIRETVFTKKEDGKVVHLRIRRRHEVIVTLLKRVAGALLLATLIGIGLNYGIATYKDTMIAGNTGNPSALPQIGSDVFFVLYAIGATVLTLGVTELSLRLTQKEGITYQAATIFLSSTVFATVLLYLAGSILNKM